MKKSPVKITCMCKFKSPAHPQPTPRFKGCHPALRSAGGSVLSGRRAPWEAALNKRARALLILLIFAASTGGLGKERQGSSSGAGDAGAFGLWKEIFQMIGMSFRISNKTPTLALALTPPGGASSFASPRPLDSTPHGPFYLTYVYV